MLFLRGVLIALLLPIWLVLSVTLVMSLSSRFLGAPLSDLVLDTGLDESERDRAIWLWIRFAIGTAVFQVVASLIARRPIAGVAAAAGFVIGAVVAVAAGLAIGAADGPEAAALADLLQPVAGLIVAGVGILSGFRSYLAYTGTFPYLRWDQLDVDD
ncbi:MAG: hypothetical protein AAGK32_05030 [Actinomycetota bacterium]